MASRRVTGTSPAGAGTSTDATGTPVRSQKVRKILRLDARARRLLARYERALAEATRAMGQARALLDDADGIESSLTGTQLGELRRARGESATTAPTPGASGPDCPSTTTPR